MEAAEKLALVAAGVFFLNGLLTGVWKYHQIRSRPQAQAHPYVDVAHRASLLYSFAALLLARFVPLCPYPAWIELVAVGLPLLFFAGAILSYVIHGWLEDTDNQFRRPHVLAAGTLSPHLVTAAMVALAVAEIGGFAVLFWGFLQAEIF